MLKPANVLDHPLDWVFSAPSHIAVLRALKDSKEGMSGRAVARAAGVNHQTCALALKKLERLGIVQRQGSGKTQLLRLNSRHFLVQEILLPFLRKEREITAQIHEEIAKKFSSHTLAAILYGSAARGQARPGSDIDLLLVVPAKAKVNVIHEASGLSADFIQHYGVRLSAIILTFHQAKERIKRSDPWMRNILSEGIDLGPQKAREVLNDAKAKG